MCISLHVQYILDMTYTMRLVLLCLCLFVALCCGENNTDTTAGTGITGIINLLCFFALKNHRIDGSRS